MSTGESNSTIVFRKASTAEIDAITRLLAEVSLPTDEVAEWIEYFFVAEHNQQVVGCAGLEVHGDSGLVRSVAVSPRYQGQKLAERLYGEVVALARQQGLRELVLLTTTADRYFARFGFKVADRAELAPELLASSQFRAICPSTAVCMRLALGCKPMGMQLSRN